MAGIKAGAQRPKTAKHLRTTTTKKFRNDDPEGLKRYLEKIQARRARKAKRR